MNCYAFENYLITVISFIANLLINLAKKKSNKSINK